MGATPREVEGSKCLLPDSPVGGSGSRRVYSLYEHFGSMIVYRNELSRRFSIEWLVNLHANLLSGSTGRLVNGIGAICLTSLCMTGAIIWWPGIKNWRRSLTVNWRAHFARISGTCIARSDCGVLSLYWCGEFQGSISLSHKSLTPCSSWIPLTILPTKGCLGSPSCILADSAGLLRPFGLCWDLYLPSWHSPAFLFAAAA